MSNDQTKRHGAKYARATVWAGRLARLAATALIFLSGTEFPFRCVNLFWGFVFAIFLNLSDIRLHYGPDTDTDLAFYLIGGIVWPLALCVGLYFWMRVLWRSASVSGRLILLLLFIASLGALVPIEFYLDHVRQHFWVWSHYFSD